MTKPIHFTASITVSQCKFYDLSSGHKIKVKLVFQLNNIHRVDVRNKVQKDFIMNKTHI